MTMYIKKSAKYPWPKLTDRLNRQPVSRAEALRQLQTMQPLSAKAQRELERAAAAPPANRNQTPKSTLRRD